MKQELEIYTRPTCSDCQDLKQFLDQHQVPHKQYNLAEMPEKEEALIKRTGNRVVPGIVFSEHAVFGLKKKYKSMTGFEMNKDEIKQRLDIR